ncbi:MAG: carboxypeptidase regulatory-like domain-containing protein [Actinomycetota bacterium]
MSADTRAGRGRGRRSAGFSYVEILVTIAVFTLMSAGVAAGLVQASKSIGKSKQEGIATKLAASALDDVRSMRYDDVGVVGGNPPGTLPATRTANVSGLGYTIVTDVDYIDDQTPGQARNYVNYKRVAVTVTPLAGTTAAVTQSTVVAPPAIAAIVNKATAIVSVVDAVTGQPVPGASVTIDQSTSATRTDVTDANGAVVFAGLEPSATSPTDPKYKYRLSASASGWATHSTTTPAVMQQHLAAQQTWNATIKMFRPATINVNLRDATTGALVTRMASVTVAGAGGANATRYGDTGTFTFPDLAGAPIEPDQYTVAAQADCYAPAVVPPATMPDGYPNTLTTSVDVTLTPVTSALLDVTVTSSTGSPVAGATVDVHGGDGLWDPILRSTDAAGTARFCVQPSTLLPYSVVATASGFQAASTQLTLPAGTTARTLVLPASASTCGIRLDAGTGDKLVRLVDQISGYTFDDFRPTTTVAGTNYGTALFSGLKPGAYKAYVESGISGATITWTPSTGKNVTCTSGVPEAGYTVP